jgi:hypothetical protein
VAVGPGIEACVVEADGERGVWLPYVEVADVDAASEGGRFRLGATVRRASREGPAGWRAVVAAQDTGPVAWQPKR